MLSELLGHRDGDHDGSNVDGACASVGAVPRLCAVGPTVADSLCKLPGKRPSLADVVFP